MRKRITSAITSSLCLNLAFNIEQNGVHVLPKPGLLHHDCERSAGGPGQPAVLVLRSPQPPANQGLYVQCW